MTDSTSLSLYGMNWVDYIILGIIIFSISISFVRGFARESVSLAIWILAIVVSVRFSGVVSDHLQTVISTPLIRFSVAFLALFLGMMIVGMLVNLIVVKIIQKTGITTTDRFLGAFFGAARGFLIVAVLLMFVNLAPVQNASWWQTSHFIPRFRVAVTWMEEYLPTQIQRISTWTVEANNKDQEGQPQERKPFVV